VLGLGFTTSYLDKICPDANRKIAVMPAPMGVIHWPNHNESMTILGDETTLPFPDCFFDRVIVAHCLESTGSEKAMMRELWRVMAVGGKIISVVPNRLGIWARSGKTPFGIGAPYTIGQMCNTYSDNMFFEHIVIGSLFMPPFISNRCFKIAQSVKINYAKIQGKANNKHYKKLLAFLSVGISKTLRVLRNIFQGFAGILIIEAKKQSYSVHAIPTYQGKKTKVRETPVASASVSNQSRSK
jgi:ubiquinone/menaquinone biosynthesis C-methylase UbiE